MMMCLNTQLALHRTLPGVYDSLSYQSCVKPGPVLYQRKPPIPHGCISVPHKSLLPRASASPSASLSSSSQSLISDPVIRMQIRSVFDSERQRTNQAQLRDRIIPGVPKKKPERSIFRTLLCSNIYSSHVTR